LVRVVRLVLQIHIKVLTVQVLLFQLQTQVAAAGAVRLRLRLRVELPEVRVVEHVIQAVREQILAEQVIQVLILPLKAMRAEMQFKMVEDITAVEVAVHREPGQRHLRMIQRELLAVQVQPIQLAELR
jgi:hypothetical protein